jgi:hypothetical protein
MSRVFVSEDTGAAIYVFTDDHCPPHVHARHRGEGWIARVRFSYLNSALELMSIAPEKKAPLQRVVNQLLDNIQERLSDCRQRWWMTNRTACLTNQWAQVLTDGAVELLSKQISGAKQITDARYDPATERLLVSFRDSTTSEVNLRP